MCTLYKHSALSDPSVYNLGVNGPKYSLVWKLCEMGEICNQNQMKKTNKTASL